MSRKMRAVFCFVCVLGCVTGAVRAAGEDQWFRRGDANGDGSVDVSDASRTLAHLFITSQRDCLSAMDANDDGAVEISDAIYSLGFLFLGTAPPPEPFESCGVDPTPEPWVHCVRYAGCPEQPGASAVGSFLPPVLTSVGESPDAFALGRINDDELVDAVVADSSWPLSGVWYLEGRGDGTFEEPVLLEPSNPRELLLEDADLDGVLDLVVSHGGGTAVSVFLGSGDGAFEHASTYEDPVGSLALTRLDADPHPDLIAVDGLSGNVLVRLGVGHGVYGPAVPFAVGDRIGPVATGDFDADGALDVAVSTGPSAVSILRGVGDGTLGTPDAFENPHQSPSGIAVGDIDGDDHLDLALTMYTRDLVSIYLGGGDGTFRHAGDYESGHLLRSPVLEDIDGDGVLDVVTASGGGGQIHLRRGIGDGTFGPAAVFRASGQTFQVRVADVDNDGKLDLVNTVINAHRVPTHIAVRLAK